MAAEKRWGTIRADFRAAEVGSVVSLPLWVDGARSGALSLTAREPGAFGPVESDLALRLAEQAAAGLTLLFRQTSRLRLDHQLRDAIASRATIDQALGILMHTHRMTSVEALEMLRLESQSTNRKVREIAADLIEVTSGHRPQPPRPLTQRD